MLLIDDVLVGPVRGLVFVLKKINEVVQQDMEAEERAIMADLSSLHRALDSGSITEVAFEAREEALLARLEGLRGTGHGR